MRLLLKLSGELLGQNELSFEQALKLAYVLKECKNKGNEICIVVGGGNLWRGRSHNEMNITDSDTIGMLGTCMNAICLKAALKEIGVKATVMSSINLKFTEDYITSRAEELIKDEIIILAGGLGVPALSTDTTAAVRGAELKVDYILKGTNVDGVYSNDPKIDKYAFKYDKISYRFALENHLRIMDTSAFEICEKNDIKLIIYNANDLNNIIKVCNGETIGTIIEKYE